MPEEDNQEFVKDSQDTLKDSQPIPKDKYKQKLLSPKIPVPTKSHPERPTPFSTSSRGPIFFNVSHYLQSSSSNKTRKSKKDRIPANLTQSL